MVVCKVTKTQTAIWMTIHTILLAKQLIAYSWNKNTITTLMDEAKPIAQKKTALN
jgi:hypothetical protein